MEKKVNVAGISIIISFALAAGKIVAGVAMNSASVIAGGIHSCMDLLAAFLSYSSVNQTKKPADEDHRYGHGKYENVAAITEAFFIFLAAVLILYNSIPGMVSGSSGVKYYDLGIAVMGVSAVVNFSVSAMLSGAFRRTLSPAFSSDRRHLFINAGASLAICIGLVLIKYKGITILDQIMALAVTLLLLFEGYHHLKKSAGGLVDVRLSEEEEDTVKQVLASYGDKYVQYHALRTRRSGPDSYVDLHMVVPRDQVISATHRLCDSIERDIRNKLPGVNVLIHAEPCRPVSGECRNCGIEKKISSEGPGSERCSTKP